MPQGDKVAVGSLQRVVLGEVGVPSLAAGHQGHPRRAQVKSKDHC